MPNRAEALLVTAARVREPGRLDSVWQIPGPEPALRALLQLAPDPTPSLVLGGGEPTLRSDFPEFIEHFGRRSILATDGLALHNESTVAMLADRGLTTVRIPIHSARADAHDWLVGIPGAHRRVRRAINSLQGAGVQVRAEVALARPTVPYLAETVAFLVKSGIRQIRFRTIRRLGPTDQNFVTTAARYGLMQPSLEAAIRTAYRSDAVVEILGVPTCAIPGFDDLHVADPTWLIPDGLHPLVRNPGERVGLCRCEWTHCLGPPRDYSAAFGWSEFSSESALGPSAIEPTPRPKSGDAATPPPPRAGRQPSTRISDIVRLSGQDNVGGNPVAGRQAQATRSVIAVRFPPKEDTRSIKLRLVHAAQQGANTLQIAGALHHPDALELIRESLRLSFPRVVVTGDLSALASAADTKLFQLRGLAQVWSPTTSDSSAVARRLKDNAKVDFRLIAAPSDHEPVALYAPPGSPAASFDNGDSWPQWSPNAVDCLA
ncbi:MAG: radical SAM protein [Myxococcota bacterium]|nr:radical SAM protein [Myxococcota bacterium]